MSVYIRITPAGGEAEQVPLLPTAVRELEQRNGKSWEYIVRENSEWAFYAAHRYMQLRKNEARPLEEWLRTIDQLEVGRDDVDPTSGTGDAD